MKLYHSPRSRSVRPRWLLEEAEAPYELVRLDLGAGEQKLSDYRKIHPHGSVPALVDGDLHLFESAALCLYLGDKFADRGLAPAPGTAARGLYYQWVVYSIATLEPPVMQLFLHTIMLPEDQRSQKVVEEARQKFAEVAGVLTRALDGRPYLLGQDFSAADIMVGSTLAWCQLMGLLGSQPALEQYVQRLTERPAYQRAQAD